MAPLRPVIRVLFDEAHDQAWSTRPEVAARMQPTHPADASYARAAEVLRARRVAVDAHADGPPDAGALAGADVVVLAHPSEPKWEATVGSGSPVLSAAELDALEAFVDAGGGPAPLGARERGKYGKH